MFSRTVSPSGSELLEATRKLREANPALGFAKFHALLLKDNPDWTVSEKRFKKVLQQHGLAAIRSAAGVVEDEHADAAIHPRSRPMEQLDVGHWSKKVEVSYFGKVKGKGLVAKEKIEKGEVLWKEDPWVISPEWAIFNAQQSSAACAFCTTSLASGSRLIVSCPSQATGCPARFCTRLCLQKSAATHPLLCPVQNPASVPLLAFAKKMQWMGLGALTQAMSKIMLANEKGAEELQKAWRVFRGLAELGMEEKAKLTRTDISKRDRDTWQQAHKLFEEAFSSPKDPKHAQKLSKLVRNPLPQEVNDELFPYDAFLRNLGRLSLNLESHGGLYVLHSHLNHACDPNVSVRHLDQRTCLSRITVLALADIPAGKELLVTYVDPSMPVEQRRRELRDWGFGECQCARCIEDAKISPAQSEGSKDGDSVALKSNDAGIDPADLEKELREGLGL